GEGDGGDGESPEDGGAGLSEEDGPLAEGRREERLERLSLTLPGEGVGRDGDGEHAREEGEVDDGEGMRREPEARRRRRVEDAHDGDDDDRLHEAAAARLALADDLADLLLQHGDEVSHGVPFEPTSARNVSSREAR